MQQQLLVTKDEAAIWTWLVSRGITSSLSGLSEMVGQELVVNSLDVRQLPVKDATALLGGPENPVIGIYLTIHGDATGHLMLVHEQRMAFELIDIQMDLPAGSTQRLEEMEYSILGEMGNITGAFFLNALADANDLSLTPSPPKVITDSAKDILNIALAEITEVQDSVLVIKAIFGNENRQIEGIFMVLPTSSFMEVILKRSNKQCLHSRENLYIAESDRQHWN